MWYLILFLFLTWFNYIGAKGRIERRNQIMDKEEVNLGPVNIKEEEALSNGTHKRLAFRQAIIGSLIYTSIIYLLFYIIF
jgi:hypothetical protein